MFWTPPPPPRTFFVANIMWTGKVMPWQSTLMLCSPRRHMYPIPCALVQDMAAETFSMQFNSFNPLIYIIVVGLLIAEIFLVVMPIVAKVRTPVVCWIASEHN